MVEENDWRIQGQEKCLGGKTFHFHSFEPSDTNDHEHCVFCTEKFGVDYTKAGYSTMDDYYWVCEECFEDFKDMYSLKVFNKNSFENMALTNVLEQEAKDFSHGEGVYEICRILTLLKNMDSIRLNSENCLFKPVIVKIFIDRSPNEYRYISELDFQANSIFTKVLFGKLVDVEKKMLQKTQLSKNSRLSTCAEICCVKIMNIED